MNATELDRLARAYLLTVRTPGDPEVAELVAAHGPALTAEFVSASSGSVWEADAAAVVAESDRADLRLVVPGDPEWPAGDPDVVGLWVSGRGQLAELSRRAVGFAGSVAATPYGVQVAARLAAELALAGRTVVTLGRLGIDAAALRGAMQETRTADLEARRAGALSAPRVAPPARRVAPAVVLPLGRLTHPEPPAHAALFRRVSRDGLLVSEHGTRPPDRDTAADLYRQGQLMAGLVQGLVLVEPGWGSRWLVDAAETANVPVLAVPGALGSEQSKGAHELIRDGRARLVVGPVDILDRIGRGRR